MKKSTLIALYLLVISNFLGTGWIINDVGRIIDPPEYKDEFSILDSHMSTFDGDTFINLKVRNNASVRIRSLTVGVNVYDTNNTLLCVVEDYVFSTIGPAEERFLSARVSFDALNEEDHRLEPFIGGAHTYYDD